MPGKEAGWRPGLALTPVKGHVWGKETGQGSLGLGCRPDDASVGPAVALEQRLPVTEIAF